MTRRFRQFAAALPTLCIFTTLLYAQRDRISEPIELSRVITLAGHAHPKANARNDRGPVKASFAMPGIILHFKPSQGQQEALDQLLQDLQNPASPNYHAWLTPERFADRFGMSANDMGKVSSWLKAEGFTIGHAARGRSWIVFSGTAEQVRRAFHTDIRHYAADGEIHYANSADPAIPAALKDVVSGIENLNDFIPVANPPFKALPDMTFASGAHLLAPDDLATIYDMTPLYKAGIDGTGQSMAIVGQSSIEMSDIQAFRSKFNLPSQTPQVILVPDLPDPGTTAGLGEADLDLEWSGAVARNATQIYVYSSNGFNAIQYVIDQNLAPVVSSSISNCEGLYDLSFYRSLAQQANAQGITWINSAGDAGAAACDPNGATVAQNGARVRFPASIPEVTGVGGTEFNDAGGSYWKSTNDANGASAVSYIPEMAWNEVSTLHALWAGGGGASGYYPKPAWQTGPGVPNGEYRDVPDVSLAAASQVGYYAISDTVAKYYYGTSGAAPSFAGMVVLANQYLVSSGAQAQPGLGNINPALYQMAQANAAVFHDITAGSNIVPCAAGSPDCPNGSLGYNAGPGYDQATGLGSPDAYNLVHNWIAQPPANSLVEVSFDKNPVYQQAPDSNGFQWTITVTLSEEAGVSTTVTGMSINGTAEDISEFFKNSAIGAKQSISTGIGFRTLNAPITEEFAFSGIDASGNTWSRQVSIPFLGLPQQPAIAGLANAASFQQAYAPGMILSVFGAQLAPATQLGAALPLLIFMGGFQAKVNGVLAPLYYVSPGQVNIQIPYETQTGMAKLTIYNFSGLQTAAYSFQVAASAPGIFRDANGAAVPFASGSRGQTYTLFITGEGQVSPSLADGTAPAVSTPLALLPRPVLPVGVTVGGVAAQTTFVGIPYGLAGVAQINFTVPQSAPLGLQQVVVTVGTTSSPPANFTVTQ